MTSSTDYGDSSQDSGNVTRFGNDCHDAEDGRKECQLDAMVLYTEEEKLHLNMPNMLKANFYFAPLLHTKKYYNNTTRMMINKNSTLRKTVLST